MGWGSVPPALGHFFGSGPDQMSDLRADVFSRSSVETKAGLGLLVGLVQPLADVERGKSCENQSLNCTCEKTQQHHR